MPLISTGKELTMKLKIKLMPPYCKKGDPDEHVLHIKEESIDLQQLAGYLSREWDHTLNFALFDDSEMLTAEFMVNGRHASLDTVIKEGDLVTVIPYICGG